MIVSSHTLIVSFIYFSHLNAQFFVYYFCNLLIEVFLVCTLSQLHVSSADIFFYLHILFNYAFRVHFLFIFCPYFIIFHCFLIYRFP